MTYTVACTVQLPPPCTCSHLDTSHDIRRDGTRGACAVSEGPNATPCGCTRYQPEGTA